jgi:hypothetical protein
VAPSGRIRARFSRCRRGLASGVLVLAVVGAACGGGGGSTDSASSSGSGSDQASSSTKGGPEEASAGTKPSYTPTGPLVADSGFRPDANGFAFANYGNVGPPTSITNLTPADMRRAFGDAVCANMAGGNCNLTPPAQQWMDGENSGMAGGHCYGFSVASSSLFKSNPPPSQFGANTTPSLDPNNQDLQREVAFGMAAQSFPNVRAAEIHGTPSEILDKTMAALNAEKDPNQKVVYSLGIYRRTAPYAGHAVTPYAVEDKGNGQFAILIYDNNYPKTTQAIMVDRNANSWSYNGSPNPSEAAGQYDGDATTLAPNGKPGTLELDPADLSAQQPCPFCNQSGAGAPGAPTTGTLGATGGATYNEIYLESNSPADRGHLLLTDDQGRRTGYVNGQFLSEIPGVVVDATLADQDWLAEEEPSYVVPTGQKVNLTIDGTTLKHPDTENATVVGPGTNVAVDDIKLAPGQKDTLVLSTNGEGVSYKSGGNEIPNIQLGVDGDSGDYSFSVKGADLGNGGQVNAAVDNAGGKLTFDTEGASHGSTYSLTVNRQDAQGEQTFKHDGVSLAPGDHASLDYGAFRADGQSVNLVVDHNGAQTLEPLTDEP